VGSNSFRWANLDQDLLWIIARSYRLTVSVGDERVASAVEELLGPLPTDAMARKTWPFIKDHWIAEDSARGSEFVQRLDANNVAPDLRAQCTDDQQFLSSVHNTAKLRATLVEWLVELGTVATNAADALAGDPAPPSDAPRISSEEEFVALLAGTVGPASELDFDRLEWFGDLSWMTFAAKVFDHAQGLLPGDLVVILNDQDLTAGNGARGATISRDDTEEIIGTLPSETLLPEGVTYTDRHVELLEEFGWTRSEDGRFHMTQQIPDGVDDLVAAVLQALREVFLVQSPAQLTINPRGAEQSGEFIAHAPQLDEPIVLDSRDRVAVVMKAIFTGFGCGIATGSDPWTFQLRANSWLIWVHIDAQSPTIELAAIVVGDLDRRVPGSAERGELVQQLCNTHLRWSRPVIRGSQLLLASTVRVSLTSAGTIVAVLNGLLTDAANALELVSSISAERNTDGTGMYL
jgi:hypothetical protein